MQRTIAMRPSVKTRPATHEGNGELDQRGDANEPDAISQDALDFDPADLDASTPAADAGPDPFDPASLRLTQDLSVAVGVKKALTTVPVRKPDRAWFVMTHP